MLVYRQGPHRSFLEVGLRLREFVAGLFFCSSSFRPLGVRLRLNHRERCRIDCRPGRRDTSRLLAQVFGGLDHLGDAATENVVEWRPYLFLQPLKDWLPFQTAATRERELVLLRDAPVDREADLNFIAAGALDRRGRPRAGTGESAFRSSALAGLRAPRGWRRPRAG